MSDLPSYVSGIIAVLLLSSFVKILTTLNIFRMGLGLTGGAFGVVIAALSLALSILVVSPELRHAGVEQSFIWNFDTARKLDSERTFRPFLERHTHPEILTRLQSIESQLEKKEAQAPAPGGPAAFSTLVPAFLLSELKEAFQVGFIILIPFLIIDLVTVNALMALGITQMSHTIVSLPLKILLFFSIDGWTLISEKLLGGYI